MNSIRTAKRFIFPLLGLWVLLYASFSLVKPPLLNGTDSIQAEAAREMAASGDWLTPRVNGVRYLEVSPLLTWSTAASYDIFGAADWAARLPLAFYALALFIVTLALGARLFLTPVAGFYASLILLTSVGIFLFAHLLFPQILVTLWMTLAFYFFWRSVHHGHASLGTAVGFGAACAFGAMSQGLVGVVVPVAVVVIFLAITGNLRHLLRWHPIEGVLVFFLMTVPWYVAMHHVNGTGIRMVDVPGVRSAPWLLEWAFLLIWIMPWCFFSIAALFRLPARTVPHSKHMDPSHQARLLLVLWFLIDAIYISFTPRHEFSVLPALPALALLAAGWLAADESAPARLGRVFAWIFFVAGVILAGGCIYFAVSAPFTSSGADIATLLHLHPGQHHLFFGHLTDLTFTSMGAFRIPLGIAAAALLVGVIGNLVLRLKHQPRFKHQSRVANCFLAGMMVFLLIAGHIALNDFSPVVSSEVLAEAIHPEMNSGDIIIVNGHYRDASALGFYLGRQVDLLNVPVRDLGRFWSDAPAIFEDDATLNRQWTGANRVFLWTTPASAPKLSAPAYLIGENGGAEILSNEPNSGGASF